MKPLLLALLLTAGAYAYDHEAFLNDLDKCADKTIELTCDTKSNELATKYSVSPKSEVHIKFLCNTACKLPEFYHAELRDN